MFHSVQHDLWLFYAKSVVLQINDYKSSMEKEGGQKNIGGQKRWSETSKKIFDLIKLNPNISRKTLSDELNINPSAIQKHIEKLIERVGGARGGYWKTL